MWKVVVITVSNSVFHGIKPADTAVQIISCLHDCLNLHDGLKDSTISQDCVPDEIETIRETLIQWIDRERADLIITTGGTGLSRDDVTPEATRQVIDRFIPGMAEEMRRMALQTSRRAMLTRGLTGTRGNSLIINLPGSPESALTCLHAIHDQLLHALQVLQEDREQLAKEHKEIW